MTQRLSKPDHTDALPPATTGEAGPDPRPKTSVIVVSRHRPEALLRCLQALSLQDHPCYEVILVADPAAVETRPDLPLKRVCFDRANVSQARNLGLAQAAGQVVAFVDDDAVAEPVWLSQLSAAFANPQVIAATGWTRGPDGMCWQARGQRVDCDGRIHDLALNSEQTHLLGVSGQGAVSTIGTNCAFRADHLRAVGGFDPAFAFHLDESDVNQRMAAAWPDRLTAVVPGAEVVHGIAVSERRRPSGVPRNLCQIGHSASVFAQRHGGDSGWVLADQRKRLMRMMLAGVLDPLKLGRLLRGLAFGLAQGRQAPPPQPPAALAGPSPEVIFQPMTGPIARRSEILSGWHWHARRLRRQAACLAEQGHIVTVLLFTPSFLPHRSALTNLGFWEQRGGVWGAAQSEDPPLVLQRRATRLARARARLARLRCAESKK